MKQAKVNAATGEMQKYNSRSDGEASEASEDGKSSHLVNGKAF
jgi:hypothetical protein